jgi:acetyl esterase/lipase
VAVAIFQHGASPVSGAGADPASADARFGCHPSRREFQRTPGLNGPAVSRAWGHYLGHATASGQHVPANRANLEGLPPTFVSCSEIDPCRDEAIDYADR